MCLPGKLLEGSALGVDKFGVMFFVFLPCEEELPKKHGGSERFQRLTVPIFSGRFLFFKNSSLLIFSLIKSFERNGLTILGLSFFICSTMSPLRSA